MALDYGFGLASALPVMTVDTVQGSVHITSHTLGILGVLVAGDPLQINGVWYSIAVVTGGFTADLTQPALDTLTGVSINTILTITALASLGVTPPKGGFGFYSKAIPIGNGLVRGAGWQTAEWRWGLLTQAQRTSLRTYISGASSDTYLIVTRPYDSQDKFQWYSGAGVWPLSDEDRIIAAPKLQRQNFTIKFQRLVQISSY